MQSKQQAIQTLEEKADASDKQGRLWHNIATAFAITWITGLATNLYLSLSGKKRLKGFGGFDESFTPLEGSLMGGEVFSYLMGAAKKEKAHAYRKSIEEIQKVRFEQDWQDKVMVPEVHSPAVKR
jgi:hypothetical protein